MKKVTNFKRTTMGAILTLALILSMGISAFAASKTSFVYNKKTVDCYLNVSWHTGKDNGSARTTVVGGSGSYPLGAFCNAYKSGKLLGGTNVTSFDTAETKEIRYTADEFRSVHNIQNSQRRPLKSTKLSVD